MKRKIIHQIITNPQSLRALTRHMNEMILEREQEIVTIRTGIVKYEGLVADIRISGKYEQHIESNIK